MKKIILALAVGFSTPCFAQTIPASSENDYFRLEYKGYTGYCCIGYIVGVENYTDQNMDILIKWDNGSQVVHLAPMNMKYIGFGGPLLKIQKLRPGY